MIFTVGELREHVTSALGDDALRRLLDATEAEIDKAGGGYDEVTETHRGGHPGLVLDRPAGTVSEVIEYADTGSAVTLSEDDYRIDGYILRRLPTGTHPSVCWRGLVTVTHTQPEDLASRQAAQLALVDLALAAGATTSQSIGDWSESFAASAEVAARKAAILAAFSGVMVR